VRAVAQEILARGATLRQAFSEAALAVFSLAVDAAAVRALEIREVRAHGPTLDGLLARWLAECSYVHEIEGFVCHAIDFAVFEVEPRAGGEPMRLHAFLHGEAMDPASPDPIGPVKVLPSSDRPIRLLAQGYEIRLVIQG
jgi:protein archease